MMVEDLFTKLSTDGGITPIAADPSYLGSLPEHPTLPAIAFRPYHGDSKVTMDGAKGLIRELVEVVSFANDPKTAEQLSKAVQASLEGFAGTMGSTAVQGIFVYSDGRLEFDQDRLQFRVEQDYEIWFRQ